MTCPLLSICIPTLNRAALLDYCLTHLHGFERFGIPFEVVVSDNASADQTAQVVRTHKREMPHLRLLAQPETVSGAQNYTNALWHACGDLVVFLADDDSLIPESLVTHVRRMEQETDLAAIYTDWIAYDDEHGRELHRYFHFRESVCFGSDDPIALLEFLLQQLVLPEVGIFRRRPLLQAEYLPSRGGYPHFHLMYQLSRLGRIVFDLSPFYREHRVLKSQFPSRSSANMETRLHYIGDEFRNHLETIALWACQDMGAVPTDEQKATIRTLIDRYLASRIELEVGRCIKDRNWLLAADLRRRMVLWYGSGPVEGQRRDVLSIVLPAALQSLYATYRGLCDVSGMVLSGFRTMQVHDFLHRHYPDVRLITSDDWQAGANGDHVFVLFRDAQAVSELRSAGRKCVYSARLDQLVNKYRIHAVNPDFSDL